MKMVILYYSRLCYSYLLLYVETCLFILLCPHLHGGHYKISLSVHLSLTCLLQLLLAANSGDTCCYCIYMGWRGILVKVKA